MHTLLTALMLYVCGAVLTLSTALMLYVCAAGCGARWLLEHLVRLCPLRRASPSQLCRVFARMHIHAADSTIITAAASLLSQTATAACNAPCSGFCARPC
jgi:hypothetical protein